MGKSYKKNTGRSALSAAEKRQIRNYDKMSAVEQKELRQSLLMRGFRDAALRLRLSVNQVRVTKHESAEQFVDENYQEDVDEEIMDNWVTMNEIDSDYDSRELVFGGIDSDDEFDVLCWFNTVRPQPCVLQTYLDNEAKWYPYESDSDDYDDEGTDDHAVAWQHAQESRNTLLSNTLSGVLGYSEKKPSVPYKTWFGADDSISIAPTDRFEDIMAKVHAKVFEICAREDITDGYHITQLICHTLSMTRMLNHF